VRDIALITGLGFLLGCAAWAWQVPAQFITNSTTFNPERPVPARSERLSFYWRAR
jgi:hypothetical protein